MNLLLAHGLSKGIHSMTEDLQHDPWTKLTDMAAAHVQSMVRAGNMGPVNKLINDLCNNTIQKREVLTKFLSTPLAKRSA